VKRAAAYGRRASIRLGADSVGVRTPSPRAAYRLIRNPKTRRLSSRLLRLAQRPRQREDHRFVGGRQRLHRDGEAFGERGEDFFHQNFRGRGAGGDRDRAHAGERAPIDLLCARDELGDLAAFALGDFAQALGIRRIGRPDDDRRLDHCRGALDRLLPVGRGVADVAPRRRMDLREARLERRDDFARVVERERRLRDIGERRVGVETHRLDLADRTHQGRRARRQLPHRADHFGVAGVADENHVTPAPEMDLRLAVDLGHQRAGGVDGEEAARARLLVDGLGDAVGRENHHAGALRRLSELLDEDDALGLQRVDDVLVVDDLVPDVDRRPVDLQRPLDDVDRARHPSAKAARGAQNDANLWLCAHRSPTLVLPVCWKGGAARSQGARERRWTGAKAPKAL